MEYPNKPNKMICPNCKTFLSLFNIKYKAGIIGDFPNQKCQKSWFVFPGENPGEFYLKPAIKGGNTSNLGSTEIIKPHSFQGHTSDFKLFKTYYFHGVDKKKLGKIKTVVIKPVVDIKKIHPLGPEGTIRIDFNFTTQLFPSVGEFNVNGKYLLNSENPERTAAILEKNLKPMIKFIKKDILKSTYPLLEILLKIKDIIFHLLNSYWLMLKMIFNCKKIFFLYTLYISILRSLSFLNILIFFN